MSSNNNNEPINNNDANPEQEVVKIDHERQESTTSENWAPRANSSFHYELAKPNPQKPVYETTPPQTAAPWYSWILFSWMVPLFEKGEERSEKGEPLEYDDLFPFPAHEDPVYNEQRLQVLWQEELKKSREDSDYKPDLSSVLFHTYKYRIFVGAFYRFLSDAATFAQPFLLREFTTWLLDSSAEVYVGWMWFIGIIGMNILMTMSLNFAQQHTMTAFTQMSNALRILVFESTLRYPSNHDEGGKITSAATVDLVQLITLAPLVHGCYISPIIVLASVGSLFIFAGYAALIVFGIMIFTIPIQGCLMFKLFSFRPPLQEAGTRRVNTLQELLQGVQLMKQMVWESNFAKRIFNARSDELVWYNAMLQWRIPLMLLIIAMPYVTNFALYALQFYFEDEIRAEKALPALTVLNGIRIPLFFIPLAWSKVFDVKVSMQRVAEVCSAHFNRHIYLQRIAEAETDAETGNEIAIEMNNVTILGDPDFSKKKNKKNNNKKPQSGNTTASPSPAVSSPVKPSPSSPDDQQEEMKQVTSSSASASASPSSPSEQETSAQTNAAKEQQIIARDLSLKIHKGKLHMILGSTGSGKSVLVQSLLGESDVKHDGGHVNIYGNSRIALVSQQAWIMNESVQKNIIMDQSFDQEKFDSAVDAAELRSDIAIFPGKEMTELGSRGVTTSGGQKARIQLARAMYSDREIIVADDPLSAVDPHVAQAIFDKCFSNEGLAKERTRVLVTHQAQLVSKADRVILMKDCGIIFDGTVDELKSSGLYKVVEEVDHEHTEKLKKEQEEKEKAAAAAKKDKEKNKNNNKTNDESASAVDAEKKQKEEKDAQDSDNTKKGILTSKEVDQAGTVTWDSYRWYLGLGGLGQFHGVMLFACLSSGCFIMANVFLALWSNKQPLGAIPTYEDTTYMWIMAAFTVAGSFVLIFRQLCFSNFMKNVAENIHDKMVRNILRAPMSFHFTTPLGRVINRLSKDLSAIDYAIFEALQMVINLLFGVIQGLITVCISAPYILIIIPLLSVYFYKTFSYYAGSVRGLKRLDGSATSPYLSLLSEVTTGLASVRAFGIGDKFKEENQKRAVYAATPAYNAKQAQRWLSARTDLAGAVILFFAAGFGCLSRTVDTTSWLPLNPALTALAISSALTTTNTITMLTRTLAEFETSFVAVERAREFTEQIPQEDIYNYDEDGNDAAPGPEWPQRGEIEFQDYKMRYRDNLPLVLHGVTFRVEAGKRYALVGKTGDGKSSILVALERLVEPAGGKILLDGRDVTKVNLPDLRSAMTLIPQDPLLFSGTIRSNLDPFDQHTDEVMWDLLCRLNLQDRLTTFITGENEPKKLDAKVSAGGSNFSVGQRQLLCLCRGILCKTKILLADECSASVDNLTDGTIQRVLREDFKGCTTLIIAHRLATIIDCDKVVVLKQGLVAEFDTPINLMNKEDSIFNGMCKKLGSQQYQMLKEIAAGEKTYLEALGFDTTIDEEQKE